MNQREQQQWDALFAAAFVAQFNASRAHVGVDRAKELASAETPKAIADLGVSCLRRWRSEEQQSAGMEVKQ